MKEDVAKGRIYARCRLIFFILCVVAALPIGQNGLVRAEAAGAWYVRSPSPPAENLMGIAYGRGTFVAVGYNGVILSSLDGDTWTRRSSGTYNILRGITYGKNTFVAVGDYATVLTSSDGIAWKRGTSGVSLWNVTYGNNLFVGVGASGTVLTSEDGITWSSRTSRTSEWLNRVVYANGIFVAVGDWGLILTSADGITWTRRSSGTSEWSFYGIAQGNNMFVTVGESGAILTSTNGLSWSGRNSGTSLLLLDVAYGGNRFAAVGESGTILTSADGESWISEPPSVTGWLLGIAWGGNTFVAVGAGGIILQSASLVIDVTPPAVTRFDLPAVSNSLMLEIGGLTAADNNGGSGIAGYLVAESSIKPGVSDPGWSAALPVRYTFASAGLKTLYAWAKDVAGNISEAASAEINVTSCLMGDINGDGMADIRDAIAALQLLTGRYVPLTSMACADADLDQRIGLPEVIYLLQKIAGLRD